MHVSQEPCKRKPWCVVFPHLIVSFMKTQLMNSIGRTVLCMMICMHWKNSIEKSEHRIWILSVCIIAYHFEIVVIIRFFPFSCAQVMCLYIPFMIHHSRIHNRFLPLFRSQLNFCCASHLGSIILEFHPWLVSTMFLITTHFCCASHLGSITRGSYSWFIATTFLITTHSCCASQLGSIIRGSYS